ncbi:hypothetical protein F2P56_012726 [Juglans regia]|uniref:VQ domain-containing protein n=2 Tax=Juglans regia TaxID=51240 RepID=A0A833XMA2_JUGRE|nr:VQ motif-containing protein 8, chloroplastic-like [Juglans regia]KAF5468583.1 hypothetical protein F2P56_012726 [Juglans regia]
MSPAKFNGDLHQDSRRVEINGQRPSPLKVNKGSHLIHKASSTSSMSISSSVSCVAPMARQQQRQPVIIYTHSPKIIHTQARDFMALVQKLTGVSSTSRSGYGIDVNKTTQPPTYKEGNEPNVMPVSHDDNESTTSALTDENSGGGADFKAGSTSNNMSSIQNQMNQYFSDMPLFTPNTTKFFCSPRPVFRYPDSGYVSPNFSNSMSPSVFEFMKELPEY